MKVRVMPAVAELLVRSPKLDRSEQRNHIVSHNEGIGRAP
jgi:hypothetical protein